MRRALVLLDVLLLLVITGLGVQLYEAWRAPGPALAAGPPASPPHEPPRPAAGMPEAPARPPLTAYGVVAERNLFSSTRTETPPEPPRPAVATGPPVPPAPKPRLYGIILLPDGKARAYLEDLQRRRVFGYSVGDAVADSRVEQIKADRVVLRRGVEVYEVLLRDPTKPKAPAVGARSTPPRPTGVVAPPSPSRAAPDVQSTGAPQRGAGVRTVPGVQGSAPASPIFGPRGRPRPPLPVPAPEPHQDGPETTDPDEDE